LKAFPQITPNAIRYAFVSEPSDFCIGRLALLLAAAVTNLRFLGTTPLSIRFAICVRHWEIIADNLSKAGWTWGCVATVDREGRTIFVADAQRDNCKRFVIRSDEMLSAFLELERITHELAGSALLGDDSH
jgi:hypothetical protein